MTLKFEGDRRMELRFDTDSDEQFVISTRLVNPRTRALFRLLNAAPRLFVAVEKLLGAPYNKYHEMGPHLNELQTIVDEIKGVQWWK